MVISMATNLNKIQLEKNNFIRKLSREQFDAVITNKYKKVFLDYFNGIIGDNDLAKKIESNLELISIYEDGDSGKIDANQYLYSAIVDVALNYYNVANGFETCINKMNLFASYFQLCAIAGEKLDYLMELIYDAFFINSNFTDSNGGAFLNVKLSKIKTCVDNLDEILAEIVKHEDVIVDVEKESGTAFIDEIHVDETIKEMYMMFKNSSDKIKDKLLELKHDCSDESTGAKLDIVQGKLM